MHLNQARKEYKELQVLLKRVKPSPGKKNSDRCSVDCFCNLSPVPFFSLKRLLFVSLTVYIYIYIHRSAQSSLYILNLVTEKRKMVSFISSLRILRTFSSNLWKSLITPNCLSYFHALLKPCIDNPSFQWSKQPYYHTGCVCSRKNRSFCRFSLC